MARHPMVRSVSFSTHVHDPAQSPLEVPTHWDDILEACGNDQAMNAAITRYAVLNTRLQNVLFAFGKFFVHQNMQTLWDELVAIFDQAREQDAV